MLRLVGTYNKFVESVPKEKKNAAVERICGKEMFLAWNERVKELQATKVANR